MLGLALLKFKSHKHSLIIKALKTESSSLAAYGHPVDEAKFLANNFAAVKYLHIRCQGNSIVHNIARHARYIIKFSV